MIPNQRVFRFVPRTELTNIRTPSANTFPQQAAGNIDPVKQPNPRDKVIYTSNVNGRAFRSEALIIKSLSSLIYLIDIEGTIEKAHRSQLKKIHKKTFVLNSSIDTPQSKTEHINADSSKTEEESIEIKEQGIKPSTSPPNSLRRSQRKGAQRHSNLNLKKLAKTKH